MRVLARVQRLATIFLWRAMSPAQRWRGHGAAMPAWSARGALLASCTIVRFIALFAHLALIFI